MEIKFNIHMYIIFNIYVCLDVELLCRKSSQALEEYQQKSEEDMVCIKNLMSIFELGRVLEQLVFKTLVTHI